MVLIGDWFVGHLPLVLALGLLVLVVLGGHRYLAQRRASEEHHEHVLGQVVLVVAGLVAVLAVIVTLPIDSGVRGSLLSLVGLLVTAVVGLSATTHVGNGLAGLIVRSRRSFRPGDFISTGDEFGRVTEMGLLHTEIQTENRDLSTIPNLQLVTSPMTVIRSSGTIVSATVSLGYDVPHPQIETLLVKAGEDAGLLDPFVLVGELGDFSVTYRLGGLLENPRTLISARSKLRVHMLNCLHNAGIEIASPTIMNQRQVAGDYQFIPDQVAGKSDNTRSVDSLLFDKADLAQSADALRDKRAELQALIGEIESSLKESGADKETLERRKALMERGVSRIEENLRTRELDLDK